MDHLMSSLNWEKSPQAPTVHGSLMNVTAKNVDYKAPIIQECIQEMLPVIGQYDKKLCPRASTHWWPLAKKMNIKHLSKGEFSNLLFPISGFVLFSNLFSFFANVFVLFYFQKKHVSHLR